MYVPIPKPRARKRPERYLSPSAANLNSTAYHSVKQPPSARPGCHRTVTGNENQLRRWLLRSEQFRADDRATARHGLEVILLLSAMAELPATTCANSGTCAAHLSRCAMDSFAL